MRTFGACGGGANAPRAPPPPPPGYGPGKVILGITKLIENALLKKQPNPTLQAFHFQVQT